MAESSKHPIAQASLPDYLPLLNQVKETLLLGQRRVEEAKVQTYWRTGKLIDQYLLKHERRADYGTQVIERLGKDLELSADLLWRCVRFARAFEILAGRQQSLPKGLTWTHYRELITIPDEKLRLDFMQRAEKSEWTAEQLAEKIRLELRSDPANGNGKLHAITGADADYKLIPKRGQLYTYRLIDPESAHHSPDAPGLWIDLGFNIRRRLPRPLAGEGGVRVKAEQIIESSKDGSGYNVRASKRAAADLFTYKAHVERVVDGDTLVVSIDLGFEIVTRQYLRLRGIDAPELSTPEGYKSRVFVEKELAKAPHIVLYSSRSEKYGRYLADVYYGVKGGEAGEPIFLNQLLLDKGLAGKMGG